MKKNPYFLAVVLILVLLVGYAYASPYITVYRIKSAIEANDTEALNESIDFPALRQNMKNHVSGFVVDSMTEEGGGSALAGFSSMLAGAIGHKMIDVFVTPTGLAHLMKGRSDLNQNSGRVEGNRIEALSNAEMGYRSPSEFVVTVPAKDREGEIHFVLRRSGLGWQLVEVQLPHWR